MNCSSLGDRDSTFLVSGHIPQRAAVVVVCVLESVLMATFSSKCRCARVALSELGLAFIPDVAKKFAKLIRKRKQRPAVKLWPKLTIVVCVCVCIVFTELPFWLSDCSFLILEDFFGVLPCSQITAITVVTITDINNCQDSELSFNNFSVFLFLFSSVHVLLCLLITLLSFSHSSLLSLCSFVPGVAVN